MEDKGKKVRRKKGEAGVHFLIITEMQINVRMRRYHPSAKVAKN